jgi:hypothetical protein
VNMLIIGGLLALALVAILGAILLGIGEERAEKKPGEEPAALPMPALPTLMSEEHQMAGPSYRSSQTPGHREEEQTMILNSQVHAFADELRFLAQQASELEQHLTALRTAFEGLQDQQSEMATKQHAAKIDIPSF